MDNQKDSALDADLHGDDPEVVLRQARERFIQAFPGRLSSIELLSDDIARLGVSGPVESLRRIVHQMTGLAGTIGLPTVSERSGEVEDLIRGVPTVGVEQRAWSSAIEALRTAFEHDAKYPPPGWVRADPAAEPTGKTILVVEDDATLRGIVLAELEQGGYRAIGIGDGALTLDRVRSLRPSLVVLDIDLPGMDGYAVCRLLKATPVVAMTPIVFMTTRSGVDDRLIGLALGADDYLQKPVDPRELLLRVARLVRRADVQSAAVSPPSRGVRLLTYEAFSLAADELLAGAPASLALIKLPRVRTDETVEALVANIRRRDLAGSVNASHLVVLMPEMSPSEACSFIEGEATALTSTGLGPIVAGVAGTTERAAVPFASLLADADEALGGARYLGRTAATKLDGALPASPSSRATVLLADDDPDVMRILDAQMRAAGYDTVLAFDGAAALAAVGERQPDLVVLDLMMPKLTGFDVLQRLRDLPTPPRTIVLTARGREDDVTRAFDLGADDYMRKPFNPQELMARVSRLMG
jgi:DNA-binding response OmpR family regulator